MNENFEKKLCFVVAGKLNSDMAVETLKSILRESGLE